MVAIVCLFAVTMLKLSGIYSKGVVDLQNPNGRERSKLVVETAGNEIKR